MEPEVADYTAEYDLIFKKFAPNHNDTKKCIDTLMRLKQHPDKLIDLLKFLIKADTPIAIINFSQLMKYLRVLARIAASSKQKPLQELTASFIVKVGQAYLFHHITTSKQIDVLSQFAGLLKPLQMRSPQKQSTNVEVLLYLASGHQPDGGLSEVLLARLQDEFFIDRKARQYRHIRLNPIMGQFVAKHFKNLIPLLQRLVVRSESNLETWKETFESTKDSKEFDGYALGCLKYLKDLLIPNSTVTIPIIKNLTGQLQTTEIIGECITIIDNLVTSNHDMKKKVTGLQFFEGLITSASRLNDEQKQLNRILFSIIKCIGRLDADIFEPVVKILRKAIDAKKNNGNKEISEALRTEMKGNNRHTLLCVAQTVVGLYSPDDLAADKQLTDIVKEFQQLNNRYSDKIAANIEIYLASLLVLVFIKQTSISKFDEGVFVNRFDFQSNGGYLRDLYTKASIKYLETHTALEEVSTLGLSIFIGMTTSRDLKVELLKNLTTNGLLRILSEGVYLYYWWNLGKSLPIKDEAARRVVHFILKKLQFVEDFEWDSVKTERLISVAGAFEQQNLLLKKLKHVQQAAKQSISDKVQHAIEFVLSKDFEAKHQMAQNLLLSFLKVSFKLNITPIEDFCQLLLNEGNYTDVDCLEDFNERIKTAVTNKAQESTEEVERLKDLGFIVQAEPEPQVKKEKKGKKPVASQFNAEQFKMMDEQEVKQDKLRRHFVNMKEYYHRFWQVLMLMVVDKQCQQSLCDNHYQHYMECMKYPELRFEFFLFTKKIFDSWPQFRRYQDFLADMFVKMGSQQVPRDHTLDKFYSFETDLLNMTFSSLPIQIINMLELVNSYLLSNLDFDVNLKIYSVKFYLKLTEDERCLSMLKKIYPFIITNINLLSTFPQTKELVIRLMRVVHHTEYTQILDNMLNYLNPSQRIVLESLVTTNNPEYKLSFEDYVKLRILQNDADATLSQNAAKLLKTYQLIMNKQQIEKFNLKRFIQNNSNETTGRLCNFARQTFSKPSNSEVVGPLFTRVIDTARELFDENFDQEGLEFFPNFLTINLDYIDQNFFEPIFELLITRYTTNEQLVTLMKLSLDAGIAIIKKYGPSEWQLLLKILELHLKHDKGVANVVFLGVLAPYVKDNKNIAAIEKRITSMFESDNQYQQKAISKCMNELMSFFKQPQQLVKKLFQKIPTLDGHLQVGQSYLFSGLLKGIGTQQMLIYFGKLLDGYENCKTVQQKNGRLIMLKTLLDNFGRIMEPRTIQFMRLIIFFMSDASEAVRDTSRQVAQAIMNKLSAYAVKNLLPELLGGLEKEENWRNKVTFIWALGNMANCAPRQLQACLPKIVPTLSACLSDTHAKIRQNATEALKVIGETIKNPEIFDNIDILISALSDPYHNSKKGLEVLLKTRFSHYIDPPALSVIVPIINYALRGRDSELKTYACQVIGSISILIENPEDLLPYIEFMREGLKVTACDQLTDIRNVATKSLGKMSSKIGIANTEKYMSFLNEILQSETANSLERQGAAQGLSECICSHGMDYFEESLLKIYDLLREAKGNQKQGYISIFIYVPDIMRQDFEPFIKEVTENMAVFVSDEDESIRNSSLQVQKILISNFGLSHTEMLLQPLFDGLFESNWRKRNGSLILIGEMLNVLKSFLYDNTDVEKEASYYQALMGVYILKDDDVDMPRQTAFKVWNDYIDNTPKTLKIGLGTLVKMWVRGIKQPASSIALRSIINFSTKYGETYFSDVLDNFNQYLNGKDDMLRSGVYDVLCEFLKKLQQTYLEKFKDNLRAIIEIGLFSNVTEIRRSVVKTLSIYVQKMHEVEYLEEKLAPRLKQVESLSEQSEEFSDLLHLFGDLCSSTSKQIVESLLRKLVEKPLSEFKIQVLTNNAARLSNYLYSMFKVKPATEILKDEIIQEVKSGSADQTKLKSLVYCFNEISVNLSEEHKGKFIHSLANDISQYSRNGISSLSKIQRKLLETLLEILIFFLDGTPPEETGNLEKLVTEITPLTFDHDKEMMNLVNKILSSLFRNPNKQFASNYFKQFAVCIENMILDKKLEGNLPIWQDPESAKLYVSIFVSTLVYGGVEMFGDILSVLHLFLRKTPVANLQEAIIRIMGAIIRISNYRLNSKQKVQLQQFIQTIYQGGRFPELDCYKYQVISLILKFISVGRDEQAITQAAQNIILVMSYSKKSNELFMDIISKIKMYGEPIVTCVYYIIKKIITTNLILDTVYEKILQQLTALLNDNDSQLSVANCYYLSKTSSRIAAALNKPWGRYEQLVQGAACPYNNMLQYLHFSYYTKNPPTIHDKIASMIKESSKDKVLYLLKSLKLLTKKYPALKEIYSVDKTSEMVSQTIRGFEDIDDMLKNL